MNIEKIRNVFPVREDLFDLRGHPFASLTRPQLFFRFFLYNLKIGLAFRTKRIEVVCLAIVPSFHWHFLNNKVHYSLPVIDANFYSPQKQFISDVFAVSEKQNNHQRTERKVTDVPGCPGWALCLLLCPNFDQTASLWEPKFQCTKMLSD